MRRMLRITPSFNNTIERRKEDGTAAALAGKRVQNTYHAIVTNKGPPAIQQLDVSAQFDKTVERQMRPK